MDLNQTSRILQVFTNSYSADTSFIIKAPFTTNSQHFKRYFDSRPDQDSNDMVKRILAFVVEVRDDIYDLRRRGHPTCYVIPYLMLQVKLWDKSEVKIVFLGGRFHHILSSSTKSVVTKLINHKQIDVVKFAAHALQTLSSSKKFILDGLVRVDVFQDQNGKLVINELESLEANYHTKSEMKQLSTQKFLVAYWEKQIYKSICLVLSL